MTELHEGDLAPDFILPRSGGGYVRLGDLKGKRVILYFYPKDDTSGCTTEACNFRDRHDDIVAHDAEVFGVSPNKVESHDSFARKYSLPFPLLADVDHQVATAYGVWKQKSLYGRKYMGIERTTFLIGTDGRIERIWARVKPRNHADDVLATLKDS